MAIPMELELRVEVEIQLLRVIYFGDFSLSEAQSTFHQILDALEKDGLRKVLIDGRQLTGDLEPLERFFYGRFVADAVTQSVNRARIEVPRFAYVLRPPILDPNRFGETVAVNRGMRIRVFEDIKQAEWWLGISPGAGS